MALWFQYVLAVVAGGIFGSAAGMSISHFFGLSAAGRLRRAGHLASTPEPLVCVVLLLAVIGLNGLVIWVVVSWLPLATWGFWIPWGWMFLKCILQSPADIQREKSWRDGVYRHDQDEL